MLHLPTPPTPSRPPAEAVSTPIPSPSPAPQTSKPSAFASASHQTPRGLFLPQSAPIPPPTNRPTSSPPPLGVNGLQLPPNPPFQMLPGIALPAAPIQQFHQPYRPSQPLTTPPADSQESTALGKRKRIIACLNCHKNKKKCSTGSTCTYCQKTERECVYPDTKPGRYQTGKNPTPKVQKRKYEVQQYQEEQYKLRLQQEEFMHQLNQYHQRLYQQQVFTPVITTLHDAVVIEDTPPPSPSPIVVEDTPPQSPELEMLEMLGSIPHKAPVVEDTALLDALVLEIPGLETQQPSTPPSKPSDPESPEAELLCQITPPDMELTVPINTSQIDSLFSLREPSPVPLASTPDSLFSMDPASPQSSISACTSLSSESPKPPSPKSGLTTPPAEAPPMEKLSLDQPPTPKSPALEPDKDIWDLSNIKMDTESPARELINELRDLPKINGCVNFDVQLSFDEVEELQAILVAGPTDFDFGSGGDNGFNWLDSGDLGLSGEADSPPSEDQGVKPQSFDEWKDFVFNEMATSTRTE